jgi:hypothetical protein
VIDMEGFNNNDGGELQKALLTIDAVLSSRIIWTGSVDEGPSHFYVKGN